MTETNAMQAVERAEASVREALAHGEATYNSMEEIRNLVAWTFHKLNAELGEPFPAMAANIRAGNTVNVLWNYRAASRLGQAKARTGYLEVNFSSKLWPRMTVEERVDTIIHEACHLAAFKLYGPGVGHDRRWKNLMVLCGRKPDRCGRVYNRDLVTRRKRTMVPAGCGCGQITEISISRANSMKRGRRSYRCATCKGPVALK